MMLNPPHHANIIIIHIVVVIIAAIIILRPLYLNPEIKAASSQIKHFYQPRDH